MLEILIAALWVGLSSASATVVLRYAPGLHKLVLEGKKPLACDVCMSLWMTLSFTAVAWHFGYAMWLAWPPSYAIAKWTLARLTDPLNPPPPPGAWEDSEEDSDHDT